MSVGHLPIGEECLICTAKGKRGSLMPAVAVSFPGFKGYYCAACVRALESALDEVKP